jgi:hypothetical protein
MSFDVQVDVCQNDQVNALSTSIETYDWIDTSNLSRLVADFARAQMLVALFDGDPQKWLEFLDRDATPEERQRELPAALHFRRRAENDPRYIDRLRLAVLQFSQLVA